MRTFSLQSSSPCLLPPLCSPVGKRENKPRLMFLMLSRHKAIYSLPSSSAQEFYASAAYVITSGILSLEDFDIYTTTKEMTTLQFKFFIHCSLFQYISVVHVITREILSLLRLQHLHNYKRNYHSTN